VAKPVGIRDVAEAAGVSLTTVSHALNGKGRLPEETRARVRAVAVELGYEPRAPHAAEPADGPRLLGLFISETEGRLPAALSGNNYFTELLGSASGTALEHGYALVLSPATVGPLQASHLDGLGGAIVVDPVPGDKVIPELHRRGIPIVTTGRSIDDDVDHWVDNDIVAGTKTLLDHLQKRGAKRIALVDSPELKSVSIDARSAYTEHCEAVGHEPLIADAAWNLSEHAGFDSALQLLDAPEPPDAIFATYDRLALGVLLAADANGISVPGDLLVAGCTDSVAARMSSPSLTVLTLNPTEVGARAADMLVGLLEGRRGVPKSEIVPTAIITRGSTRRPVARRGHANGNAAVTN
jgi:DNA-binding LacI/PurR family transcriptional regulator